MFKHILALAPLALMLITAPVEAQKPAQSKPVTPKAMTGAQVMAQVQKTYSELKTYSDTGTIINDVLLPGVASSTRETHTFVTRFQGPRSFKFDFKNETGDRIVVWCPGDASFWSWWKSSGVTQEYPKGQGSMAFATADYPTISTILTIPPLLFPGAGLQGPFETMREAKFIAIEQIGGKPMYKVKADIPVNHWGDSTRATTIWVDAETFLIRQVFQDNPTGEAGKTLTTTILVPTANAAIPASEFAFKAPK